MQEYCSDIAFYDFALTLICDMSRHVVIVTRLAAVFVAENQIWHETRLSFLTSFVPVMFSSDSWPGGKFPIFGGKWHFFAQILFKWATLHRANTSAVVVEFSTIVSLRM